MGKKKLGINKLASKLTPETLLRIQKQELSQPDILSALIHEAFGVDSLSISVGTVERKVIAHIMASEEGEYKEDIRNREFAIKCDALANYAVPGYGESYDRLRSDFAESCCRGLAEYAEPKLMSMQPGESATFAADDEMQAGFDRACCELYRRILRQCYNSKRKLFKKNCKVHGASLADFSSILKTLFHKALQNHPFKDIYEILPELYKIAGHIQKGDHKCVSLCWECCEVTDCQSVCSQCQVARYCGEACQIKAWKGGHRFSCPSVKKMYENHTTNHNLVKAAFADPEKHETLYGYKPNSRIDYLLILEPFQRFSTDDGEDRFELPSMKHFYWNLSQVKSGLLWCDHPSTIPDIASTDLCDLVLNDNRGLELVVRNGLALSHQYPDYDNTIETFHHRNAELHSNWLTGSLFCKHEEDSNCTAAEFLKAYATWEVAPSYTRIFEDSVTSHASKRMRDYDEFQGSKLLMRKTIAKVWKRKRRVFKELHERHLEGLRTQLATHQENLEKLQKELTAIRKKEVHLELKALVLHRRDNPNCVIS